MQRPHKPNPLANKWRDMAARDLMTKYDSCLIRPGVFMSDDEDAPIINISHVLDAGIVGLITFCAVVLGDRVPALIAWISTGQPFTDVVYLTPMEISARIPMAFVAFLLTFCAQWARYRGIKYLRSNGFNSGE